MIIEEIEILSQPYLVADRNSFERLVSEQCDLVFK